MATQKTVTQKDIQTLQRMKADTTAIARKIAELEQQRDEHNLVIKTLSKLEPGRRCYRMVGGVLVQRTVGEALPAITQNKEALDKSITSLEAEIQERNKQMAEFAREKGLLTQNVKEEEQKEKKSETGEKKSSGLLV